MKTITRAEFNLLLDYQKKIQDLLKETDEMYLKSLAILGVEDGGEDQKYGWVSDFLYGNEKSLNKTLKAINIEVEK